MTRRDKLATNLRPGPQIEIAGGQDVQAVNAPPEQAESIESLQKRIRVLEGRLLAARLSANVPAPLPPAPSNELDLVRMRLAAIEASRSWRMMTKLQRIVNILRGVRTRFARRLPALAPVRPVTGQGRFAERSAVEAWSGLLHGRGETP